MTKYRIIEENTTSVPNANSKFWQLVLFHVKPDQKKRRRKRVIFTSRFPT